MHSAPNLTLAPRSFVVADPHDPGSELGVWARDENEAIQAWANAVFEGGLADLYDLAGSQVDLLVDDVPVYVRLDLTVQVLEEAVHV